MMDYTKFFSDAGKCRKPDLISTIAANFIGNPKSISLALTFPFEETDVKYKGGTVLKLRGSDLNAALQYCATPGVMMDYTKFFSDAGKRRRPDLIRTITANFIGNPKSISLAPGMPNALTFPFEEIDVKYKGGTVLKLRGSDLNAALQYCATPGIAPLVAKWRELQEKWHGPKFENWDVQFLTGSQEGCTKLFELLMNTGDPVMIQTPTFTGILSAIFPLQPEFIAINQDSDGIIPEEVQKVCEERTRSKKQMPKFLYVNPVGANPTGTVLPEERKREIYRLAQKYNFLILEDDAYYFLHFMEKQPLSFLSIDTDGRVIRLDSFSKIMSSGLRLGVVTAHKDIIQKLNNHAQSSTIHASSLSQVLIYNLLVLWNEEKLEEHFKSLQDFYRSRRDIMIGLIEKHLTGLAEWTKPKGGFFCWLKIKNIEDVYNLVMQKCADKNVFMLPGNPFYYNPNQKCQYVRLSYSSCSEEDMKKALKILGDIIKNEVKNYK